VSATRFEVEVLAGTNVGQTFDFSDETVVVGRAAHCALQLNSPHVSRQQCELSWQGDQLVLENLGTVNVTYLNDRPIERVYVQDGDLITFCDVALRVRMARRGEPTADPDRTVVFSGDPSPPNMGPETTVPPGPAGPPRPPPAPPPQHRPPASPGAPGHIQSTAQFQAFPNGPPGVPQPQPAHLRPGPPPGPPPGGPPAPQRSAQFPSPGMSSGQLPAASRPPGPQRPAPGTPAPPPGMPGPPPGMPGPPPGMRAPAGMPGPPPGMPGAPPGMPMPPGGGSMTTGPGRAPDSVESARKKKRKAPNAQMIRNVAIVVIAVSLLLIVVTLVQRSGSTKAPKTTPAAAAAPAGPDNPAEALPVVERGPRTDEEILAEADRLYRVAKKFHEEYLVSDERLWEAYSRYQTTKAQLLLVDQQKWPGFAREIQPRVDEVSELLDAEYRKARINYVRNKDAGNYEGGIREMERLLRMFPDKNDTRHQFAREKKRQLRSMMKGKKKKSFL